MPRENDLLYLLCKEFIQIGAFDAVGLSRSQRENICTFLNMLPGFIAPLMKVSPNFIFAHTFLISNSDEIVFSFARIFFSRGGTYCITPLWGAIWFYFFVYLPPWILFLFQIFKWNLFFFARNFLSPEVRADGMLPYGVPF